MGFVMLPAELGQLIDQFTNVYYNNSNILFKAEKVAHYFIETDVLKDHIEH